MMLSRTADHLFWMARYTERAENTARLLSVNCEMALMPPATAAAEAGWRALLDLSDLQAAYGRKYADLSQAGVIDFMVRDESNPVSIKSCLKAARDNARAVRTSLTTEVWEAINTTWLRLQAELAEADLERDPVRFLEWVKYRSHLSRGVISGTMLNDESKHFITLGTYLERADNTARLLDAKFQPGNGPRPTQSEAGPEEFYYWAALLRSVSAFEIYRKVYRDVIDPERVVELLVLHPDMPRSLLYCMHVVVDILRLVGNHYSKDTERWAGRLHAQLRFGSMEEVSRQGLHRYLKNFMDDIYALGTRIGRDFLVADRGAAAEPAPLSAPRSAPLSAPLDAPLDEQTTSLSPALPPSSLPAASAHAP